ncbi:uncharacterized protein LOC128278702 [Anopheles cruzii]|uniref:uncharacterized protein LOC128278702 n=1 Tax=Anopheles cruzii TaxID=68878 RepID=UPI0022EC6EEB|nr:uncharacterized protein LOC128278702 [Anopheles cruzii]
MVQLPVGGQDQEKQLPNVTHDEDRCAAVNPQTSSAAVVGKTQLSPSKRAMVAGRPQQSISGNRRTSSRRLIPAEVVSSSSSSLSSASPSPSPVGDLSHNASESCPSGALSDSDVFKVPSAADKTKPSLVCSLPLDRLQSILAALKTNKQYLAGGSGDAREDGSSTYKLLCLYCDRTFSNQLLMVKHTDRVHRIAKERRSSARVISAANGTDVSSCCMLCHKGKVLNPASEDLSQLFKHLVKAHSDRYHACEQCVLRFPSEDAREAHVEAIHPVVSGTRPKSKAALKAFGPGHSIYNCTSSSSSSSKLCKANKKIPSSTNVEDGAHQEAASQGPVTDAEAGGYGSNIRLRSAHRNASTPESLDAGGSQSKSKLFKKSERLIMRNAEPMLLSRLGIAQHRLPRQSRRLLAAASTTTSDSLSASATVATSNGGRGGRKKATAVSSTDEAHLPENCYNKVTKLKTIRSTLNVPSPSSSVASSETADVVGGRSKNPSENLANSASGSSNCVATFTANLSRCCGTGTCTGSNSSSAAGSHTCATALTASTSGSGLTSSSGIFDEDFYESVNRNVHNNLSCHLDGKLAASASSAPSPLSLLATIPAVRSTVVKSPLAAESMIHEATNLPAVTVSFPTLLTVEQYGSDSISTSVAVAKTKKPITKHSWKWKWHCVKKYKYVNENGRIVKKIKQPMQGLRDLTKLDMWTQLTMRTKHERTRNHASTVEEALAEQRIAEVGAVLRQEKRIMVQQLNNILDARLLPQIDLEQHDQRTIKVEPSLENDLDGGDGNEPHVRAALAQCTSQCASVPSLEQDFLQSLQLLQMAQPANHKSVVLSGEWARPRCYICYECGSKFATLKQIEEHRTFRHPHVHSTFYEIVGRELIENQLYKHFFIPLVALSAHQLHYARFIVDGMAGGTASMNWFTHREAGSISSTEIKNEDSSSNEATSFSTATSASSSASSSFSSITSSSTTTATLASLMLNDSTNSITSVAQYPSADGAAKPTGANENSTTIVCSKCRKECPNLLVLYAHILHCSNDYVWLQAKKRMKYRRAKRRRAGGSRSGISSCAASLIAAARKVQHQQQSAVEKAETASNVSSSSSSVDCNSCKSGSSDNQSGVNGNHKKSKSPKPKENDSDIVKRLLANLPEKRHSRQILQTSKQIRKQSGAMNKKSFVSIPKGTPMKSGMRRPSAPAGSQWKKGSSSAPRKPSQATSAVQSTSASDSPKRSPSSPTPASSCSSSIASSASLTSPEKVHDVVIIEKPAQLPSRSPDEKRLKASGNKVKESKPAAFRRTRGIVGKKKAFRKTKLISKGIAVGKPMDKMTWKKANRQLRNAATGTLRTLRSGRHREPNVARSNTKRPKKIRKGIRKKRTVRAELPKSPTDGELVGSKTRTHSEEFPHKSDEELQIQATKKTSDGRNEEAAEPCKPESVLQQLEENEQAETTLDEIKETEEPLKIGKESEPETVAEEKELTIKNHNDDSSEQQKATTPANLTEHLPCPSASAAQVTPNQPIKPQSSTVYPSAPIKRNSVDTAQGLESLREGGTVESPLSGTSTSLASNIIPKCNLSSAQKRRPKKLNDCIAMLTGMLSERIGVDFFNQTNLTGKSSSRQSLSPPPAAPPPCQTPNKCQPEPVTLSVPLSNKPSAAVASTMECASPVSCNPALPDVPAVLKRCSPVSCQSPISPVPLLTVANATPLRTPVSSKVLPAKAVAPIPLPPSRRPSVHVSETIASTHQTAAIALVVNSAASKPPEATPLNAARCSLQSVQQQEAIRAMVAEFSDEPLNLSKTSTIGVAMQSEMRNNGQKFKYAHEGASLPQQQHQQRTGIFAPRSLAHYHHPQPLQQQQQQQQKLVHPLYHHQKQTLNNGANPFKMEGSQAANSSFTITPKAGSGNLSSIKLPPGLIIERVEYKQSRPVISKEAPSVTIVARHRQPPQSVDTALQSVGEHHTLLVRPQEHAQQLSNAHSTAPFVNNATSSRSSSLETNRKNVPPHQYDVPTKELPHQHMHLRPNNSEIELLANREPLVERPTGPLIENKISVTITEAKRERLADITFLPRKSSTMVCSRNDPSEMLPFHSHPKPVPTSTSASICAKLSPVILSQSQLPKNSTVVDKPALTTLIIPQVPMPQIPAGQALASKPRKPRRKSVFVPLPTAAPSTMSNSLTPITTPTMLPPFTGANLLASMSLSFLPPGLLAGPPLGLDFHRLASVVLPAHLKPPEIPPLTIPSTPPANVVKHRRQSTHARSETMKHAFEQTLNVPCDLTPKLPATVSAVTVDSAAASLCSDPNPPSVVPAKLRNTALAQSAVTMTFNTTRDTGVVATEASYSKGPEFVQKEGTAKEPQLTSLREQNQDRLATEERHNRHHLEHDLQAIPLTMKRNDRIEQQQYPEAATHSAHQKSEADRQNENQDDRRPETKATEHSKIDVTPTQMTSIDDTNVTQPVLVAPHKDHLLLSDTGAFDHGKQSDIVDSKLQSKANVAQKGSQEQESCSNEVHDQSAASDSLLPPDSAAERIVSSPSVQKITRKRRKNELASILSDQLLESFKEVDKSRLNDLKLLHDITCEKPDVKFTLEQIPQLAKRKSNPRIPELLESSKGGGSSADNNTAAKKTNPSAKRIQSKTPLPMEKADSKSEEKSTEIDSPDFESDLLRSSKKKQQGTPTPDIQEAVEDNGTLKNVPKQNATTEEVKDAHIKQPVAGRRTRKLSIDIERVAPVVQRKERATTAVQKLMAVDLVKKRDLANTPASGPTRKGKTKKIEMDTVEGPMRKITNANEQQSSNVISPTLEASHIEGSTKVAEDTTPRQNGENPKSGQKNTKKTCQEPNNALADDKHCSTVKDKVLPLADGNKVLRETTPEATLENTTPPKRIMTRRKSVFVDRDLAQYVNRDEEQTLRSVNSFQDDLILTSRRGTRSQGNKNLSLVESFVEATMKPRDPRRKIVQKRLEEEQQQRVAVESREAASTKLRDESINVEKVAKVCYKTDKKVDPQEELEKSPPRRISTRRASVLVRSPSVLLQPPSTQDTPCKAEEPLSSAQDDDNLRTISNETKRIYRRRASIYQLPAELLEHPQDAPKPDLAVEPLEEKKRTGFHNRRSKTPGPGVRGNPLPLNGTPEPLLESLLLQTTAANAATPNGSKRRTTKNSQIAETVSKLFNIQEEIMLIDSTRRKLKKTSSSTPTPLATTPAVKLEALVSAGSDRVGDEAKPAPITEELQSVANASTTMPKPQKSISFSSDSPKPTEEAVTLNYGTDSDSMGDSDDDNMSLACYVARRMESGSNGRRAFVKPPKATGALEEGVVYVPERAKSVADDESATNTEAMDDDMSVTTEFQPMNATGMRGGRRRRKRRKSVRCGSKIQRQKAKAQAEEGKMLVTYNCDLCKKVFKKQDAYNKHRMTLSHIAKLSEQEFLMAQQRVDQQLAEEPVPDGTVSATESRHSQESKQHQETHCVTVDTYPVSNEQGAPAPAPPSQALDGALATMDETDNQLVPLKEPVKILSQEEKLFYECCSMLKESSAGDAVGECGGNLNLTVSLKSNEAISGTGVPPENVLDSPLGSSFVGPATASKSTVAGFTEVTASELPSKEDDRAQPTITSAIDGTSFPLFPELVQQRPRTTMSDDNYGSVSPQHSIKSSSASNCSLSFAQNNAKIKTKGALKGFDNFKVSIPMSGLIVSASGGGGVSGCAFSPLGVGADPPIESRLDTLADIALCGDIPKEFGVLKPLLDVDTVIETKVDDSIPPAQVEMDFALQLRKSDNSGEGAGLVTVAKVSKPQSLTSSRASRTRRGGSEFGNKQRRNASSIASRNDDRSKTENHGPMMAKKVGAAISLPLIQVERPPAEEDVYAFQDSPTDVFFPPTYASKKHLSETLPVPADTGCEAVQPKGLNFAKHRSANELCTEDQDQDSQMSSLSFSDRDDFVYGTNTLSEEEEADEDEEDLSSSYSSGGGVNAGGNAGGGQTIPKKPVKADVKKKSLIMGRIFKKGSAKEKLKEETVKKAPVAESTFDAVATTTSAVMKEDFDKLFDTLKNAAEIEKMASLPPVAFGERSDSDGRLRRRAVQQKKLTETWDSDEYEEFHVDDVMRLIDEADEDDELQLNTEPSKPGAKCEDIKLLSDAAPRTLSLLVGSVDEAKEKLFEPASSGVDTSMVIDTPDIDRASSNLGSVVTDYTIRKVMESVILETMGKTTHKQPTKGKSSKGQSGGGGAATSSRGASKKILRPETSTNDLKPGLRQTSLEEHVLESSVVISSRTITTKFKQKINSSMQQQQRTAISGKHEPIRQVSEQDGQAGDPIVSSAAMANHSTTADGGRVTPSLGNNNNNSCNKNNNNNNPDGKVRQSTSCTVGFRAGQSNTVVGALSEAASKPKSASAELPAGAETSVPADSASGTTTAGTKDRRTSQATTKQRKQPQKKMKNVAYDPDSDFEDNIKCKKVKRKLLESDIEGNLKIEQLQSTLIDSSILMAVPRRKRNAVDMLYYWSSTSDEDEDHPDSDFAEKKSGKNKPIKSAATNDKRKSSTATASSAKQANRGGKFGENNAERSFDSGDGGQKAPKESKTKKATKTKPTPAKTSKTKENSEEQSVKQRQSRKQQPRDAEYTTEEFGTSPTVPPEEDDFSGDTGTSNEHLQQHGWIVGDSHKKLVTLLAHAKVKHDSRKTVNNRRK